MSSIKIYLASRHEDRPDIVAVRSRLQEQGFIITSRWLTDQQPQINGLIEDNETDSLTVQTNDLEDIDAADVLVVFSPKKAFGNSTGGRHVELGYALAKKKKIVLVGYRENVFHWNPAVLCVRTEEALFKLLKNFEKNKDIKFPPRND